MDYSGVNTLLHECVCSHDCCAPGEEDCMMTRMFFFFFFFLESGAIDDDDVQRIVYMINYKNQGFFKLSKFDHLFHSVQETNHTRGK